MSDYLIKFPYDETDDCNPFCVQLWISRIGVNIYLVVELLSISICMFRDLREDLFQLDYIGDTCNSPWTALFVIMISNAVLIGNIQDFGLMLHVSEHRNKDDWVRGCCPAICGNNASMSIFYSFNGIIRIWVFGALVAHGSECYSDRMFGLMVMISGFAGGVIVSCIMYGIVGFCTWCCATARARAHKLAILKTQQDKETNFNKVCELERAAAENKAKMDEIALKAKMTSRELEETKHQLKMFEESTQIAVMCVDN